MSRRHTITRAAFRVTLRTLKWGSLAAALLVAGVWAGGSATMFNWTVARGFDRFDVYGRPGRVLVLWNNLDNYPSSLELRRVVLLTPGRNPFKSPMNGWSPTWLPSASGLGTDYGDIRIPYWLPILLFASISGGLFWRDRRAARRARVGMCPSCGYSRAGLALDAVCPECGKPKV